jgi:hypothetical protein
MAQNSVYNGRLPGLGADRPASLCRVAPESIGVLSGLSGTESGFQGLAVARV